MKNKILTPIITAVLLALPASAQILVDSLTTSGLAEPNGVIDAYGSVYVTDGQNHRIARYDRANDQLYNLAGSPGQVGTNVGTGTIAQFSSPYGIIAARGGLVVADSGNHLIRFVGLDGTVTNFAGAPLVAGATDGVGDQARFRSPLGLAADTAGNIYVADSKNNAIRKIDTSNLVTTIATGLFEPAAVAVGDHGDLWVAETRRSVIQHLETNGVMTLIAGIPGPGGGQDSPDAKEALFNYPRGLAWMGPDIGLLISDTDNHSIRRLYVNAAINTYSVTNYAGSIAQPGLVNGLASSARFRFPLGLCRDTVSGGILVADRGNNQIRLVHDATSPSTPVLAGPAGLATDSTGSFIFIADRDDNTVRRLELAANRITTFASTNLNNPVAVALDAAENVYVLNEGNATITKFNRFANLLSWNVSGLVQPTAISIDNSTNIYVTEIAGTIRRADPSGTVTLTATLTEPGVQLRGIAVMDDGLLAVSDSGNEALWLVNPADGTYELLTGHNGTGSTQGAAEFAQFNGPRQLAKAGGDLLVVADAGNHRLAVVDRDGTVTNLFTDSSVVFYGAIGDPVLPSDPRFVPLTNPLGTLVTRDGDVFSSESTAGVLRWTTETGLNGPGQGSSGNDTGGGSGIVLTPPLISPNSGYYPMGQIIQVTSPNPVYFTTNGSDPTTNSSQVSLQGNVGSIIWNDSLHDLTWLRLRAISGTNLSAVVSGIPVSTNNLGVTRDVIAGIGSVIVVPIVMDLRSNDMVRSLQYRVEIIPQFNPVQDRYAPPLPTFSALPVGSNDFVQVVGASVPGTVGTYTAAPYSILNPNLGGPLLIPGGLAISAIGTNANFQVQDFATVAMVKVPIDASAVEGDQYLIAITAISATSDGWSTPVGVSPMANRLITVSNLTYLVGDSASSTWYNAGDFGDADLNNNDVNSAFYASLGVRAPFNFTDVFDAMDTFPPDDDGFVGGDGEIRFLDWQLILLRSLHLDTNNYVRSWSPGGWRTSTTSALPSTTRRSTKSISLPPAPGAVWVRQATLSSQPLAWAMPGGTYQLPVIVNVAPGCSLSGLSFRAALGADSDAPPVGALNFVPAPGQPMPIQFTGLSSSELLCGWPLVPSPAFAVPLQGSNVIGSLRFTVPAETLPGQTYTLRFSNADGAPNLATQYDLDSIDTTVWVGGPAQGPAELVSEQWKTNFFGSMTNPLADAFADADGDGVPNWKEFLAGTNPTNRLSRLEILGTSWINAPVPALVLRWLTAPDKSYLIERTDRLDGTNWMPVAEGVLGDGQLRLCLDTNATNNAQQFYRVRLQP